jgi:hypothetical protein
METNSAAGVSSPCTVATAIATVIPSRAVGEGVASLVATSTERSGRGMRMRKVKIMRVFIVMRLSHRG